jgi:hypothetical protein
VASLWPRAIIARGNADARMREAGSGLFAGTKPAGFSELSFEYRLRPRPSLWIVNRTIDRGALLSLSDLPWQLAALVTSRDGPHELPVLLPQVHSDELQGTGEHTRRG